MKEIILIFVLGMFSYIVYPQVDFYNDVEMDYQDKPYLNNESKYEILYFTSTSNDNNLEVKRKWWATVLVDAAGALGGAASVATFINVASITPAGWVAIGVGAVVGGAGASLARAGNLNPSKIEIKNLPNKINDLDYIGSKHNQIIKDYLDNYPDYTANNYFQFITINKSKYGIENIPFELKYFEEQLVMVKKLDTDEKIVDFVLSILPDGIDHDEFKSFLIGLNDFENGEELVENIKRFENKLNDGTLSNDAKLKLLPFFSTLRYSSNLW